MKKIFCRFGFSSYFCIVIETKAKDTAGTVLPSRNSVTEVKMTDTEV